MHWDYPLSDNHIRAYNDYLSGTKVKDIAQYVGVSHVRIVQMVAEVRRRCSTRTSCPDDPDDVINLNISEYVYKRLIECGIYSISQLIDMNMSSKVDELLIAIMCAKYRGCKVYGSY